MRGQWLTHSPDNAFTFNIEIDKNGGIFEGRAYIFAHNTDLVVAAHLRGEEKDFADGIPINFEFFLRGGTAPISIDDVKTRFPGSEPKTKATLKLLKAKGGLEAILSYDDDTPDGLVTFPKSLASTGSVIEADKGVSNWSDFKEFVSTLERDRYIFRGQTVQKRLRTAFHRSERTSLFTFVNRDIPRLHRALSPHMKHYFNLADSNQYGAFWSLAQHHGFPTPLLDWTYSPYVAGYFAYRRKRREEAPDSKVRIFMFDSAQWTADCPQFSEVLNRAPHFSLLHPLALENPRALPQQALSTLSTVDDIESYLTEIGEGKGREYLRVFDLPYSERAAVLGDLRMMGVTAASLFPGIDGTCEALRMDLFEE